MTIDLQDLIDRLKSAEGKLDKLAWLRSELLKTPELRFTGKSVAKLLERMVGE